MAHRPDAPDGSRYVQDLLDGESAPVPAVLRDTSAIDMGDADLDVRRYTSDAFAGAERDRLWPRVWQMACREEQIPAVGDSVVYECAGISLVVVRTAGGVRAFHNACLHRGTQLRTQSGRLTELRCPFHGFTWDLDGRLVEIPCRWDFPQIETDRFCLPEAQVASWGGFVFVNPDVHAPPFPSYAAKLIDHFTRWPLEERWLSAHVVRFLPCNWKVALEAFIESFHTLAVHPQLLRTTADTGTQYDVWPDAPYVSRMVTPVGVSSEHLGRVVPEEEILGAMFVTRDDPPDLPPGTTARQLLGQRTRDALAARTGRDFTDLTDSEALDGIAYFLFPNFMPWAGYTTPLVYRFRPDGDDPGRSLMDVMLLDPLPAEGTRPDPSPTRVLEDGQTWADAPELGYLGRILNQDTATVGRVQRGLRTTVKPGVTLAHYQESRIRHFHAALDAFLEP
jgi:phenylpropionate dioxygenase-like ring-hydroxylating dioxygenase large terminal subunit